GTGLLFLLLVFMYVRRLLSIAAQSKDLFGCLLTRGYAALLLAQFIWSCAMAVGLAPVGSSILPFVSHGG
ncbi:FtsW/RodA/SpoVE family cell cycle protein, partial [Acinetobacter baumannii]|uniref:FtsW/RodA/SpoVE family cell cycle protein n=1 Tax=Acinetobacter baumannii TaxID=470 RepID=UPI00148804EB